MPHVIRLRDPWRCEPLAGQVRYLRRFGRPTGLMPGDQVHLTIEKVEGEAEVVLNGEVLGHIEQRSARFDVTSILRQSNEVIISFHLRALADGAEVANAGQQNMPGDPLGLVSLEITSAQ